MPVIAKKIGDKYRIVEKATGKIAKNNAGTAIDGGGHDSEETAKSQASAVNISYARKHGAKIPRK